MNAFNNLMIVSGVCALSSMTGSRGLLLSRYASGGRSSFVPSSLVVAETASDHSNWITQMHEKYETTYQEAYRTPIF
jgi:hypothetical protein